MTKPFRTAAYRLNNIAKRHATRVWDSLQALADLDPYEIFCSHSYLLLSQQSTLDKVIVLFIITHQKSVISVHFRL